MRYLVFGGDTYYATGGANDLHKAFDVLEDAAAYAMSIRTRQPARYDHVDWVQVFDVETLQIVYQWGKAYGGDEGPNSQPGERLPPGAE